MMEQSYPRMKQVVLTTKYRQLMIGLIMVMIGLALASVPNRFEGISLLHLPQGHGVSVSDGIALIPLLCGAVLVLGNLWFERVQLRERVQTWLRIGGVELFLVGMAAGIVINRLVFDLPWGRMLIWVVIAAVLGGRLWLSQRRAD
jgi:nucleoside recognition membrane protein YjiH